jgi:Dyp-type peroxidase family
VIRATGIELDDIQGIIVRGYGALHHARYVLLRVQDGGAAAARAWLGELAERVRDGTVRPQSHESCVNAAFTHSGLAALGLPEAVLDGFAPEFREGMITPHRQRMLGDHGRSAPSQWRWGGSNGDNGAADVHMMLALYAGSAEALDGLHRELSAGFSSAGWRELLPLSTIRLPDQREHFGFRDGVAQPWIRGKLVDDRRDGSERDVPAGNVIAAGEFLLGYDNEYGELPASPTVPAAGDPEGVLENAAGATGQRDLGRNGSYMVFRQLRQDVVGFWRYVDQRITERQESVPGNDRVWLASKMVGRWPSGAPLSLYPDADPAVAEPHRPKDDYQFADNFGYAADDRDGQICPRGSHIRRTNPRDVIAEDPAEAVVIAKRHRILRRGRAFGDPIDPSMDPAKLLAGPDEGERGLHFVCFNTNIGRQFEFIQQTWANNQKFAGLYEDADPLIGDHDPRWREDEGLEPETGSFTVPGCPFRFRTSGMPRFVDVLGGAYFFMPGKRALRWLASLP